MLLRHCIYNNACYIVIYSVWNWRVPVVLLEPPVLSGVLQSFNLRRCGNVRHNGAHCRVVHWIRPDVQGACWPLRLDTHSAGVKRRYYEPLLVWSHVIRCCFQQRRILHVHVAETRFRAVRQTARRYSPPNTITYTRSQCILLTDVILYLSDAQQ